MTSSDAAVPFCGLGGEQRCGLGGELGGAVGGAAAERGDHDGGGCLWCRSSGWAR